jgi:hypothetical protein
MYRHRALSANSSRPCLFSVRKHSWSSAAGELICVVLFMDFSSKRNIQLQRKKKPYVRQWHKNTVKLIWKQNEGKQLLRWDLPEQICVAFRVCNWVDNRNLFHLVDETGITYFGSYWILRISHSHKAVHGCIYLFNFVTHLIRQWMFENVKAVSVLLWILFQEHLKTETGSSKCRQYSVYLHGVFPQKQNPQ